MEGRRNERCDVGKPAASREVAAGSPRQGEGDDAREVQEAVVSEMDREGLPLIYGHRMAELPDARGEGAEEHLGVGVVCDSEDRSLDVLAHGRPEAVDGDLAAREGLVAEPHGDGDASSREADWRGRRICGFDLLLGVDGPAQGIDEDVLTEIVAQGIDGEVDGVAGVEGSLSGDGDEGPTVSREDSWIRRHGSSWGEEEEGLGTVPLPPLVASPKLIPR